MNEDESREWRNRLGEVLTEYNLQWVLEQVEQHIRLGRTSEEEIQTFSERRTRPTGGTGSDVPTLSPTPAYSPGRKARFVASRDFTANEILEIIIDAVERGIADTAEMQAEMLKQFEHRGIQYEVVLVRDEPVSKRTVVAPNDAVSRAASASRLRDLLRELRAEI
jgi:hypothetical protein